MKLTEDHLSALREATLAGSEEVLAAAVDFLASISGSERVTFIKSSMDGWKLTGASTATDELIRSVDALPQESVSWEVATQIPSTFATFIPIRVGSLAIIIERVFDSNSEAVAITRLAAWMCDLLLKDAERIDSLKKLLKEVGGLPPLPFVLLSVREIDQLLLSSVNAALQLLEADMAGVFILEGEELVMSSCVGHRSSQTAQLSMNRGQGLAGRVLEYEEVCSVDDYLGSSLITHDFDSLAQTENVRSALAAPLAINSKILGVLEVWARRPSAFQDTHIRRIDGVANLVSIAIFNAQVFEMQKEDYRQLSQNSEFLQEKLSAIQSARSLQKSLSTLLLAGEDLQGLVRVTASELSARAIVLSDDFEVLANYPEEQDFEQIVAKIKNHAYQYNSPSSELSVLQDDGNWIMVKEILAGRDRLGRFLLITDYQPSMSDELAFGEAVLHSAICRMMQRAIDDIRLSEREEVVWDLLEGSSARRIAALERSTRLRVQLVRPHRVVRSVLYEVENLAEHEGWNTAFLVQMQRQIQNTIRRTMIRRNAGELLAIRGNELAAIIPIVFDESIRILLRELALLVTEFVPQAKPYWGVSAICERSLEFGRANIQALTSLRAAQRIDSDYIAIYDKLGVVKLLLASHNDVSLKEFVGSILGPLIEVEDLRNQCLLETLRTYLSVDCSQQRAAEHLFTHHKTIRYRLNQIKHLTGLDLSKHEDRVNAELALKIHEVMHI